MLSPEQAQDLVDHFGSQRAAARATGVANTPLRYWLNHEKVSAQRAAYRAANRERVRTYQAAYRAANRERVRTYKAAYYAANREKVRTYQAAYRSTLAGVMTMHRSREREQLKRQLKEDTQWL